MKIKFRKLSKLAVTPTRAHEHDAGFDLTATHCVWSDGYRYLECRTSIAVSIPVGFVGLLFPRSSVRDRGMILANCVGVLDSGYIGEIVFSFVVMTSAASNTYSPGDRIGQLVVMPLVDVELEEVDALENTKRGFAGLGSTGR